MTARQPAADRRPVRDVLLVVAVGVVDLAVWSGDRELRGGGELPLWLVPAATVVVCAALLARRRYPVTVFAFQTGYSLISLVVPRYQPFACLLVALYTVAARLGPRPAAWTLVAGLVPFAVFSYNFAARTAAGDFPFVLASTAAVYVVLVAVVWALGRLAHTRERQARAERERLALDAERALEAERQRLARELHDSVTGAVTTMILHVAGARARLTPDEQPVREILRVVEQSGVQAMNELHRMLGLLRAPDGRGPDEPAGGDSRPGVAALEELVERARGGGLPVEFTVTGQARPLDPSVDLAAYRIVQESLTNVVKHTGPDAQARVSLCWGPGELRVRVHSSGTDGSRTAVLHSSGHGLRGLQERVRLVGGTLDAGREADGWQVLAELPVTEA